jgi:hypothetical protein
MPRSEWDDNTWYDDGEFPPVSRDEGRSGMIAAAVFSFLMCALNACFAAGFGLCFGCCLFVNAQNQGAANFFPADMVQFYMVFFLTVGTISGLCFFLQLFAGIGLLRGRRWARTTTLWLSGYSILLALGLVGITVYTFVNGAAGNQEAEQWAVMIIGTAIVHGVYALIELCLLLQPSVARRYR